MTVVSGCMARRQDRHAAHGDAGRWADRRRSGSYRVGNRGAHVRGHASRLSMGADRQVPDRGALTVSVRRPCLEPGCCSYVVGAQGRSNRKTWRCDAHQKLRRAAENKARHRRPDQAIRNEPAYRAMPKPYGKRCAIALPNVCLGSATTWDPIIPLSRGGNSFHDESAARVSAMQRSQGIERRIRAEKLTNLALSKPPSPRGFCL